MSTNANSESTELTSDPQQTATTEVSEEAKALKPECLITKQSTHKLYDIKAGKYYLKVKSAYETPAGCCDVMVACYAI